jgi:hypothetical protein
MPDRDASPFRVDKTRPISDHLLNRGLAYWSLALPNLSGGKRLWDLTGHAHGTLTNEPEWATAPGGFGAIRSTGGAGGHDYVVAQPAGKVPTTGPFTLSFAMRHRTSTGLSVFGGFGPHAPMTADRVGEFRMLLVNGTNYWWSFSSSDWNTGIALDTDSEWHFVSLTHDGATTAAFYRDGVQRATTVLSVNAIGQGEGGTAVFQNTKHYGGANSPDADVASLMIHGRALSQPEASELARQWRAGFPDMLRRYPSRAWSFGAEQAAGGGGTGGAWWWSKYGEAATAG